jgi:hypothetical protein
MKGTRRPGLIGGIILIALLASSCSNNDPAVRLGACTTGGSIDIAPPLTFLASAERWFEVVAPSKDFTDPTLTARSTTVTLTMQVAQLDGSATPGPATNQFMAIHTSFLPGINWALSSGGHALLALAVKNLDTETVLYVLIRKSDGTHFFAGNCEYKALTKPVRELLGAQTDQTLDKLPGIVGTEQIDALLAGETGT